MPVAQPILARNLFNYLEKQKIEKVCLHSSLSVQISLPFDAILKYLIKPYFGDDEPHLGPNHI